MLLLVTYVTGPGREARRESGRESRRAGGRARGRRAEAHAGRHSCFPPAAPREFVNIRGNCYNGLFMDH